MPLVVSVEARGIPLNLVFHHSPQIMGINCKGAHSSISKMYPMYRQELEIRSIGALQNITIQETQKHVVSQSNGTQNIKARNQTVPS